MILALVTFTGHSLLSFEIHGVTADAKFVAVTVDYMSIPGEAACRNCEHSLPLRPSRNTNDETYLQGDLLKSIIGLIGTIDFIGAPAFAAISGFFMPIAPSRVANAGAMISDPRFTFGGSRSAFATARNPQGHPAAKVGSRCQALASEILNWI